ncbi:MAG: sporulation-delaying protein SdpB family protein [Ekhidna sp.]
MLSFTWSNVVGLSRALLALGTLSTLLFNSVDVLFYQFEEILQNDLQKFGLFYLLKGNFVFAKILSIGVLGFVISGYYPRVSCILHWYVTASFMNVCSIPDGGDHVSSVLSLLLIPIVVMDPRKNHWDPPVTVEKKVGSTIASSFLMLVKLQMMAIYLHAFVAKLFVPEWTNGTATYYWLLHEYHGIHDLFAGVLGKLLSFPIPVIAVTWGTLAFEFLLAACILLEKGSSKKQYFLWAGISFHFGIFLIHGLGSFFLAMVSGLILYLRETEVTYEFKFAPIFTSMKNKMKVGFKK